jgi:hypothetical protein
MCLNIRKGIRYTITEMFLKIRKGIRKHRGL